MGTESGREKCTTKEDTITCMKSNVSRKTQMTDGGMTIRAIEGGVEWGATILSTRGVEPGRSVSSPESRPSSSSSQSSAGTARYRGLPQGREDCTFLLMPLSKAVTILLFGVFALRLRKLLLSKPNNSIS